MSNLDRFRTLAGLPLDESECSSHVKKERALFKETAVDLKKIEQLCKDRLKADINDAQTKQYKSLLNLVQQTQEGMATHLKAYEM